MSDWTIWHFEHSDARGIHLDLRFSRPVRVRDIERIEKFCAIWREIAAEEETREADVSFEDGTPC
jgi:hypothetical protein